MQRNLALGRIHECVVVAEAAAQAARPYYVTGAANNAALRPTERTLLGTYIDSLAIRPVSLTIRRIKAACRTNKILNIVES